MQLETLSHDKVEQITLPRQLVIGNTQAIRAAILAIINSGHHHLILDLRQVESVDSSGLSVLVSTLKSLRKTGGEVVLLSPSETVRTLIELTRLHQVFEIFEDPAAAVSLLRERSEAA